MIDLLCLLKLPPEGRNKLKPELRLLLNCSQGLSQNRCQTPNLKISKHSDFRNSSFRDLEIEGVSVGPTIKQPEEAIQGSTPEDMPIEANIPEGADGAGLLDMSGLHVQRRGLFTNLRVSKHWDLTNSSFRHLEIQHAIAAQGSNEGGAAPSRDADSQSEWWAPLTALMASLIDRSYCRCRTQQHRGPMITINGMDYRSIRVETVAKVSEKRGESSVPDKRQSPGASEQQEGPPLSQGQWEQRLLDFVCSAEYSAEAYAKLETFFRGAGNRTWADWTYRTGLNESPRHKWTRRVWEMTLGHGRAKERALFFCIPFLLVGTLVFPKRRMEYCGGEGPRREYSRFWYALDLFLPIIDLHQANYWMPKQDHVLAWHYARIHRLFGWFLVPIGLAAFAGLIN